MKSLFFKSVPAGAADLREPFSLELPLLFLSPNDAWRIRDACEGTQIFGATGSGKTSGSGKAIARAFLRAGFGGIVLTAKSDETSAWQRYAEETGRSDSLIVLSAAGENRINFLEYERCRPGAGAGLTENLVRLFMTVMEIVDRSHGASHSQDYWQNALKQLLRNAIDLVSLSGEVLSLAAIYDTIATAAQSLEEVQSSEWQRRSSCFARVVAGERVQLPPSRRGDFELTARYWLSEFPGLAARTRSVIVSSFTSLADGFLRSPLRELFCTTTTFVPELTHQGAVLVVDLPVKEFGELGQCAQVLLKLLWQQATERRNPAENPRPVFLWADEAQFFLTSRDVLFQTTARSARACTVYLTQNLPAYLSVLDVQKGKAEADSLLGNLQTKVFHANSEATTNQWASDSIARTWQVRASASSGSSYSKGPGITGDPQQQNSTQTSVSHHMEYQVLPEEFTRLRKGGPEHGLMVDAVVFQGGRRWKQSGTTFLRTSFSQRD